jgi:hypothetical protein
MRLCRRFDVTSVSVQENFVSGSIGFITVFNGMSEDGEMQYRKNTHGKAV